MIDISSIIDDYRNHAEQDYVGLWMIVARFEDLLGAGNRNAIRSDTMEVVRGLLSRGLCPIDYTSQGTAFWLGSKEQQLARIEREWDKLADELPDMANTICWFAECPDMPSRFQW